MISERRNQLLSILYMLKQDKEEDIKRNLDNLLDSIERDINNQLKELKRQREELEDNYLLLEYVRKEIYEK